MQKSPRYVLGRLLVLSVSWFNWGRYQCVATAMDAEVAMASVLKMPISF